MGFKLVGAVVTAFAGVIIAVIGIMAIFLFAILGALIGAITGFILSLVPFLGDLVVSGFAQLGFPSVSLPAVGATLGFIAGFFKQNGNCSD